MNDLAEKGLAGLVATYRAVRDHPMTAFGVLGCALGSGVVVVGGQVGAAEPTRPLTTWLGLQVSNHAPRGLDRPILLTIAIVALVVAWLGLTEFVRRRPQRRERVWRVAAFWALPFVIGPPLLDTNVYGRVATGLLQRAGLDPHVHAPIRLGDAPVVGALDPSARGTPSSDGPLGIFLSHLAVSISGGSALGAVLVLRVVAVLAVFWSGRLVAAYAEAGRMRADRALTLVVANPLVLLYLVSAAHLDALTIVLVLAAVTAARRRRWTTAVALASLAASVTGWAFVSIPVLVAAHLVARRRTRGWVSLGRDTGVAVAVVAVLGLAVPGGFGWVHTVSQQFADHTPFSIPGVTASILRPIVAGAGYDDLAVGGRAAALVALACTLGYLVVTARARPVEQGVGYALLAVALFAPALHPWYLLGGVLCLAATATGGRRLVVLALSAGGCVLVLQGFSDDVAHAVTGGLLAVLGAASLVVRRRLDLRDRRSGGTVGYRPPETSRTAGRTSAR